MKSGERLMYELWKNELISFQMEKKSNCQAGVFVGCEIFDDVDRYE